MTQQEIIESQNTKTEKIRLLLAAGLTRKQVAEAMGIGYGFVQNVYAKHYPTTPRRRTVAEEAATVPHFRFTFNRNFGVEIEAFGVSNDALRTALTEAGLNVETGRRSQNMTRSWKVTTDATVFGATPFELVSPILRGEEGLEELRKVCVVLKRLNVKINKTCGLHIHLSATDLQIEDWKRLYINYATLENRIDAFMPNSRRASNNRYCKSIAVTNYRRKAESATTLEGIEQAITSRDRYYKLNTQAYWRHRTVEFRQHSGTIEFDKISNWVLFCARLVEFSRQNFVADGNDLAAFCSPELLNFYQQRTASLA